MTQPLTMTEPLAAWEACRFLTCSVLPVRYACNLTCPFCFSKSSISSLKHETQNWSEYDLHSYYEFSQARGANRLVITGGGEPLLRPQDVLHLVRVGRKYFDEIACFTNGTFLTRSLADELGAAGLSYLCYSRHHDDDNRCRELMGEGAPNLETFFTAAGNLKVRATCVMTKEFIESPKDVWRYIHRLAEFGVNEFTLKHTYVVYERSVFGSSSENRWAKEHQIESDPFHNRGTVLAELPWGPRIRHIDGFQVCYYHEPTPQWEKEHQLCRSINLLSNGKIYASLEDQQSRLFLNTN